MTPLSSSDPAAVQPAAIGSAGLPEGTRVALLTPPGRGALAVVGVQGPAATSAVDRLFAARSGPPVAARPDGAIAFGTWRPTGEDVVVVRLDADRVEVHGHGGTAAPEAILASLERAGAARCRWEEWLTGGPCGREALTALPAAWAPRAAMILARQATGLLDAALSELAGLAARGARPEAAAAATRLLAAARVGGRLVRPWRVVFSGRVNAGKSSLVNAILGHARSIVSPEPGTTRDVIATPAVLGGWGVELIDVAGTREPRPCVSATEQAGIERATAARDTADLVLRVVPADEPWPEPAAAGELVVLSKSDLTGAPPPPGALATSAATGAGIAELIDAIVDRLVPEDRRDPALLAGPVPFTGRQAALIEQVVRPADYEAASSAVLPRT